jgi:hypothetical protein
LEDPKGYRFAFVAGASMAYMVRTVKEKKSQTYYGKTCKHDFLGCVLLLKLQAGIVPFLMKIRNIPTTCGL